MPENLVLLHGFAGTHRAWDGVIAALAREPRPPERYRPLALDLPGHGTEAHAPRPITFAACVEHVLARERTSVHEDGAPPGPTPPSPQGEGGRFALCGYSLGGRLALHVALAAPERVSRLVLVSTSPGIEDARERAARRAADERLARELEGEPFEQFIERWRAQPLFAGEPPEAAALARDDQRRNRPDALAAVLRGLGAGQMQPLWQRLGELRMPVTVVAGERDRKYAALGRRAAAALPDGELVILPGGHGLALESPAALARVLARA
ncbi:MAG TPA: alpha/beta fold hydrolase [Solirubrobacteraceae bacterium]|nr:alpha/beta fold hydrolase [Solirubrobacteraceae bacterium]